jgi:hypothetical protein
MNDPRCNLKNQRRLDQSGSGSVHHPSILYTARVPKPRHTLSATGSPHLCSLKNTPVAFTVFRSLGSGSWLGRALLRGERERAVCVLWDDVT